MSQQPQPQPDPNQFGKTYTGKDVATWALYGHPEYAGVYQTPPKPGFGTTYTGKEIATWALAGHPEYAGRYAPPTIPEGYKVSSVSETDRGVTVVFEPTMQTILHARGMTGASGGPLLTGMVIPKGVNVIVDKQGEYVQGSNPLADLISTSGKAVGAYMNPKITFSPEEASALGSGDAGKVLAVESPKLVRQGEVLGGVALATIAPEVVIPGALASLGVSEVASEVVSHQALTPSEGAQALLVGGLFSAGAAGITSVVSSVAARGALIAGMGAGFGYATGGPRGALLGAGVAGVGYLGFNAVSDYVGGRAEDWLTSKAFERGPLESASLNEKVVGALTRAKPEGLAQQVVSVPTPEAVNLPGMEAQDVAWDIAETPKSSAVLFTESPGDVLGKAWVKEHLFKTISGGLSYSMVQRQLESVPTPEMPHVPSVGEDVGDLSRLAFSASLFREGQVQVLLPKVQPVSNKAMPYVMKLDLLTTQKQEQRNLIAQLPIQESLQVPIQESGLVSEQALKQEAIQQQVPVSLQKQELVSNLDVAVNPEAVRVSAFLPSSSGFDLPRRTKRVQFERRGFTSVFRGWPVRRPSEVLKMGSGNNGVGFELPKPSTKRLKLQIGEEKKSSQMYRGWGYPKIARQETAHRRTLEAELKRRQRKR